MLLLPPKYKNCNHMVWYLFGLGIDYLLIQKCIADSIIYENADYHTMLFLSAKMKAECPNMSLVVAQ